jgi:hypothetical protein
MQVPYMVESQVFLKTTENLKKKKLCASRVPKRRSAIDSLRIA